ncbi:hypothetical protein R3P38DRAFT_2775663 [Favolaschia claudopus]|uniref:Uncharacterized protein n=1 Tax=Favolaschia claudopus TaxID=2862362 RepID=A0AAW0BS76_9AGAR
MYPSPPLPYLPPILLLTLNASFSSLGHFTLPSDASFGARIFVKRSMQVARRLRHYHHIQPPSPSPGLAAAAVVGEIVEGTLSWNRRRPATSHCPSLSAAAPSTLYNTVGVDVDICAAPSRTKPPLKLTSKQMPVGKEITREARQEMSGEVNAWDWCLKAREGLSSNYLEVLSKLLTLILGRIYHLAQTLFPTFRWCSAEGDSLNGKFVRRVLEEDHPGRESDSSIVRGDEASKPMFVTGPSGTLRLSLFTLGTRWSQALEVRPTPHKDIPGWGTFRGLENSIRPLRGYCGGSGGFYIFGDAPARRVRTYSHYRHSADMLTPHIRSINRESKNPRNDPSCRKIIKRFRTSTIHRSGSSIYPQPPNIETENLEGRQPDYPQSVVFPFIQMESPTDKQHYSDNLLRRACVLRARNMGSTGGAECVAALTSSIVKDNRRAAQDGEKQVTLRAGSNKALKKKRKHGHNYGCGGEANQGKRSSAERDRSAWKRAPYNRASLPPDEQDGRIGGRHLVGVVKLKVDGRSVTVVKVKKGIKNDVQNNELTVAGLESLH